MERCSSTEATPTATPVNGSAGYTSEGTAGMQVDPKTGLLMPMREEARIQCPYCERKFNQDAAERHIPKCSKVQHRPKGVKALSEKAQYRLNRLGQRVAISELPSPNRSQRDSLRKLDAHLAPPGQRGQLIRPSIPSALSHQWAQVFMLFSDGWQAVDSDEKINESLEKARRGLEWVTKVEGLAKLNSIPKGKLSRMLLPFKEDTDAKDQSNVCTRDANMGSPALDNLEGFADNDVRKGMVQSAIGVRKFLRIKVADCADFEFLKDNLLLILAFFQNLRTLYENLPNSMGTSPHNDGSYEIWRSSCEEAMESSSSLAAFLRIQLGEPIAHKFREGPEGGHSL